MGKERVDEERKGGEKIGWGERRGEGRGGEDGMGESRGEDEMGERRGEEGVRSRGDTGALGGLSHPSSPWPDGAVINHHGGYHYGVLSTGQMGGAGVWGP